MKDPKKFVGIAGTVTAAIGLFITVAPAFFSKDIAGSGFFRVIGILFEHGQLTIFESDFWQYYNYDEMRYPVNYFHLVFFCFMLLGSILFLWRGFKESRLLGFCFSMIFLLNVLQFIYITIVFIRYFSEIKGGFIWMYLLTMLSSPFWVWLSYRIINIINQHNQPEVINYETDGVFMKSYILANRWQRFMHLFVDRIMIILVFSAYIFIIGYIARDMPGDANIRDMKSGWFFYSLVSTFMLIYYPLFETIFGITPAKFLTNTIVIKENGNKPGFQTILLRTLSRLVPFEAWSFLFGEGWHDRWTRTWVIKNENKGIKNGWYLLLFPLAGLFVWAGYLAMSGYHEHKEFVKYKAEYDTRMSGFKEEFKRLTTEHYFKLSSGDYSFSDCYLKVESPGKDRVSFTKMNFGYNDQVKDVLDARNWYAMNPDKRDTVDISRSALQQLLDEKYDDDYRSEGGVALFSDGVKFSIKEVYNLNEPCLKESEYGSNISSNRAWEDRSGKANDEKNNYTLFILLHNYGTGAEITSITSLEGGLKWNIPLPATLEGAYSRPGMLELVCSEYEYDTEYKTKIVLKDGMGKTHTYMIEGRNTDYTLRRVY